MRGGECVSRSLLFVMVILVSSGLLAVKLFLFVAVVASLL
jgi:hypothetical protein